MASVIGTVNVYVGDAEPYRQGTWGPERHGVALVPHSEVGVVLVGTCNELEEFARQVLKAAHDCRTHDRMYPDYEDSEVSA